MYIYQEKNICFWIVIQNFNVNNFAVKRKKEIFYIDVLHVESKNNYLASAPHYVKFSIIMIILNHENL